MKHNLQHRLLPIIVLASIIAIALVGYGFNYASATYFPDSGSEYSESGDGSTPNFWCDSHPKGCGTPVSGIIPNGWTAYEDEWGFYITKKEGNTTKFSKLLKNSDHPLAIKDTFNPADIPMGDAKAWTENQCVSTKFTGADTHSTSSLTETRGLNGKYDCSGGKYRFYAKGWKGMPNADGDGIQIAMVSPTQCVESVFINGRTGYVGTTKITCADDIDSAVSKALEGSAGGIAGEKVKKTETCENIFTLNGMLCTLGDLITKVAVWLLDQITESIKWRIII